MKKTLIIENATIFWLNFAGQERQFNPPGRRTFCVEIDEDLANQLQEDGWNVKVRPPREEGDEARYHLQVELKFTDNPIYDPDVEVIANGVMRKLTESDVHILDEAEIINVDLEINPHDWGTKRNGERAIKAYVKRLYVTIQPNLFDIKYGNYINPADDVPFDV